MEKTWETTKVNVNKTGTKQARAVCLWRRPKVDGIVCGFAGSQAGRQAVS